MSFILLIELAVIQGLTEFLPVSSSGHLALFGKFGGFIDQGIDIDIALHIGSLFAVLIYFYNVVGQMVSGLLRHKLLPNFKDSGNRLAYMVVVASLPILMVGFLLRHYDMDCLRSSKVIGWTILLYGMLLYWADKVGKITRTTEDITIKDALFIGLAQCLALVPGTSRSGITITTARFLGINRSEAAKFSMLLSVPTILAAGVLTGWRLYQSEDVMRMVSACEAVFYSFGASMVVIFVMMKWLKKATYLPFVIYRVVLGLALIFYSYGFF